MIILTKKLLVGPFSQILTMDNLPLNGALFDEDLEVIENGGLLLQGNEISQILTEIQFNKLLKNPPENMDYFHIKEPMVVLPGFIDIHTHICYAGSRADEYALKLAGKSYLEIAKSGGGILSTVNQTRNASEEMLITLTVSRARNHLKNGVTTMEVKSGYGLSIHDELKILNAIKKAKSFPEMPSLVPTCLAAHVKPPEFDDHEEYLNYIVNEILPIVKSEELASRVDIFIEDGAFNPDISLKFLQKVKTMGFSILIHADQFSSGGSLVASKIGAISADHLEASSDDDLNALKEAGVHACVLPGASIGLGIPFAPARKILDQGLSLVIASDWNPGSAPMGDLLTQAAILGVYEKLSVAETLAGITVRAAHALNLPSKGIIKPTFEADLIAFSCSRFSEILYRQGALKPKYIWKSGNLIDFCSKAD